MEKGWGAKTEEGEPANENDSDSLTSFFFCCLHFTSNALSIALRLHIISASFYLLMCCLDETLN